MTKFLEFVKNIDTDDIDLYDKLENLCEAGQISDELYINIKDNHQICNCIEKYIREHILEYQDTIEEETRELFLQGLIKNVIDFSSGLYNCDTIYILGIVKTIGIYWLPKYGLL